MEGVAWTIFFHPLILIHFLLIQSLATVTLLRYLSNKIFISPTKLFSPVILAWNFMAILISSWFLFDKCYVCSMHSLSSLSILHISSLTSLSERLNRWLVIFRHQSYHNHSLSIVESCVFPIVMLTMSYFLCCVLGFID